MSEVPLRPRIARMFLIRHLIRSGALTPGQAIVALQAGQGNGPSLARFLVQRGWVSPQAMGIALDRLRDAMIALE